MIFYLFEMMYLIKTDYDYVDKSEIYQVIHHKRFDRLSENLGILRKGKGAYSGKINTI